MQTDFIEVTLAVIDAFDQLQIPYLIGGSLASALHGLSRTTLDSDLVAAVRIEHVPHLINMLGNQFYISDEAIYDAIRHHSSFNLIHLETMFKVDIFLPKGRPFDHAQMRNRQLQVVVTAPERTAYVASPEDTIVTIRPGLVKLTKSAPAGHLSPGANSKISG